MKFSAQCVHAHVDVSFPYGRELRAVFRINELIVLAFIFEPGHQTVTQRSPLYQHVHIKSASWSCRYVLAEGVCSAAPWLQKQEEFVAVETTTSGAWVLHSLPMQTSPQQQDIQASKGAWCHRGEGWGGERRQCENKNTGTTNILYVFVRDQVCNYLILTCSYL